MKYLPITGPQAPFKDGPADAEMYSAPGSKTFYYRIASIPTIQFWQAGNWVDLQGNPSYPILGRRRVIAEPNHWTAADQQAGQLPAVGKLFSAKGQEWECVHLLDGVALAVSGNSYCAFTFYECNPIETAEEKAKRLRDEWCEAAAGIFMRHPSSSGTVSMNNVYDALLSGELTMPVKDGE